jgi:uncharacterized protein
MSRKILPFLFLPLLAIPACEREPDLPPPEPYTTPTGSVVELPYGQPRIEFETATVVVETDGATHRLQVEIAEDGQQRARGLMYRSHLPEDAGMLFVYDEDRQDGFWMLNTWIPLDIAFIDAGGEIVDILRMQPCLRAPCPTYAPNARYRTALEVNQGWFAARGIETGDRVELVGPGSAEMEDAQVDDGDEADDPAADEEVEAAGTG